MSENTIKKKELKVIKFDTDKLIDISFGQLEGERDTYLKDCFFPTKSVTKYLRSINSYNYVLSPKGAGKSALFRAMTEGFVPTEYFNDKEYSIIAVNQAFGFDDNYLNLNQFQEKRRMNLTISWALFILSKLILNIRENYSNKDGYHELINEISKIQELKEKFNLYDLSDFLRALGMSIEFTANGQEFSAKPKFTVNKKDERLNVNKIFTLVNKFYQQNDIKVLILIDRLDNFVQKEEYHLQRRYIQGLFDCVEEISLFSNILPTVFLRTDLFHSYDSDVEYDKIKDRTIELEWERGETLNFLVNRLINNKYIDENYFEFIIQFVQDASDGKLRQYKNGKNSIFQSIINFLFPKKKKELEIDTSKPLNYTVSDRFLKIFFPDKIAMNDKENLDFSEWIFTYLKDANSFINPRLLIYFFNQLFEKQSDYNFQFFPDKNSIIKATYTIEDNLPKLDLFDNDVFKITYEFVQQQELKFIHTILKKKIFQDLFKALNSRCCETGDFRYNTLNLKSIGTEKTNYESCLKYLKLLGFCEEFEKHRFRIPNIYKQKLKT
ncbi:hypothetical protein OAD49_04065 [Flavobacteriaceae bacterium]|nr:hypothetical protein [Flavobacteriaceae bacterium]